MIHAEDLSYRYPDGKTVLKNLNFTIDDGEFVAIIGQNGSGKTTLLKHFNGLLKPTGGRMMIGNLDVATVKTSRLASRIGFLFQNPDHQIFCKTVYEEIAFGLKNIGVAAQDLDRRVSEAAAKVGIASYAQQNPFSLSKGERQRVALASVMAMGTETMVLDEPTTGQDYQESLEIMGMIRQINQQGKTIIVVTHDMEIVAQYAKRVIILDDGQIVEDGPTETVLCKGESLALSNLQPPQIYLLAKMFHQQGLFQNVYTVAKMFQEIMAYLEGEENARVG